MSLRRVCLSLPVALSLVTAALPASAAQVSLSSEHPKQGQTVEIKVSGADGAQPPVVKFNGNEYKLFPSKTEGVYQTLMSVPADLDPGSYKLQVGTDSLSVHVLDGRFSLQHLRLPPAKDNFDMSPGEKEAVEGAKATLSDTRMWNGAFVRPSKFRTSTGFGMKRVVNGHMLKDYFHSGLDFAAPAGSPIVSTADGTVIMTGRNFRLHGNCVAVDHGQGVISIYIHMKTISVKKGEHVRSGEKLGTVGQTGRANGPHLHFSIYVNQVATNPMDWFQHAF